MKNRTIIVISIGILLLIPVVKKSRFSPDILDGRPLTLKSGINGLGVGGGGGISGGLGNSSKFHCQRVGINRRVEKGTKNSPSSLEFDQLFDNI